MDIEFGTHLAIAALTVAMVLGTLAFGALHLYIAHLRLAEVLEHLRNSALVDVHQHSHHLGIRWRSRAVHDIAGLLTYPDCPVEFGGMSAQDIRHFPRSLKTLLILSHRLKLSLLAVLVMLAMALQMLTAIQYQGPPTEIRIGGTLVFLYSSQWLVLILQLLCIVCLGWVGNRYAKAGMRYMNSASRYLAHCKAVVNRQRPVMYSTVFGRIVFTVCIAALLAHSRFFIRRGSLQVSDVESFPATIKAELVVSHYVLLASVVGLSASFVATRLIH